MITAIKTYLTTQLVAAGIPDTHISDEPDKGEWPPAQSPYAELITDPEKLRRDGKTSARTYDDVTKLATVHTCHFKRELPVRIRLVHKDEAALETMLNAFLTGLARRIEDGDQFIRVLPEQAAWGGKKLPADRRQVEIRIRFLGGIYSTPGATGTLQSINAPATPAIN